MSGIDFKTLLVEFLQVFSELDESYKTIYEKIEKMEMTDKFKETLLDKLVTTENVEDFVLLKNTDIKERWEKLDEELKDEMVFKFQTLKQYRTMDELKKQFEGLSNGDEKEDLSKLFDSVVGKLGLTEDTLKEKLTSFMEKNKDSPLIKRVLELLERFETDEDLKARIKTFVVKITEDFGDTFEEVQELLKNPKSIDNSIINKIKKIFSEKKITSILSSYTEEVNTLIADLGISKDIFMDELPSLLLGVKNEFGANPLTNSIFNNFLRSMGMKSQPKKKQVDPKKKSRKQRSKYREEYRKELGVKKRKRRG